MKVHFRASQTILRAHSHLEWILQYTPVDGLLEHFNGVATEAITPDEGKKSKAGKKHASAK
jgi:hypothetical protein